MIRGISDISVYLNIGDCEGDDALPELTEPSEERIATGLLQLDVNATLTLTVNIYSVVTVHRGIEKIIPVEGHVGVSQELISAR